MTEKNVIFNYLCIAVMFFMVTPGCNSQPKVKSRTVRTFEDGKKKIVEKFRGEGEKKELIERVSYDREGRQTSLKRFETGGIVTHINFYENGAKSAEYKTKNNLREGLLREWFEDGSIKSERFFVHDQPHGKFLYNFPNNGKHSGQYLHGKPMGTWTKWWNENTKMEIIAYDNGISTGEWIRWYNNGQKELEAFYVKGKLNGYYTEWHPNGKMKVKGSYVMGKFKGSWIKWSPEGKVLIEKYY